ncbi:MAG: tetratricopeptide repeat protein [Candidatus Zixiibacteriota bacterium]|jgi:tetratricopeptide (TPR) repeat protein
MTDSAIRRAPRIPAGRAVILVTASFIFAAGASAAPPVEAETPGLEELIRTGRYEEAIAVLLEICAPDGDLDSRFRLAYCYERSGRLEEARAEYEYCARLDPDRPEIYYNLGVVLSELGRHDDAARAFEEALLLNPGHVDANFNCGLAHYYGREPVQAIRFFREARALAPDDLAILCGLALAYEEIDRRVALSIWEDYVSQALDDAGEQPYLKTARDHISTLRAGKKP